jgi:hypothetical protein
MGKGVDGEQKEGDVDAYEPGQLRVMGEAGQDPP